MLFTIAQFIAGITGFDIQKVQKWTIIGAIGLILLIVLAIGLWLKSCSAAHKLKVNQAQVEKINKADEKERKAEYQKIVTENADVVTTTDERTTIAETNETEKQAQIYAKVQEADEKVQAAKAASGRDVSQDELECILVPQHCK
jgi:hypothetical protein